MEGKKTKIKKDNKVTGELAKFAISEEKPAEIVYQVKKGQVLFRFVTFLINISNYVVFKF